MNEPPPAAIPSISQLSQFVEQEKSRWLNCLMSIMSFETYWAYYSLSDGLLYDQECRDTARSICEHLRPFVNPHGPNYINEINLRIDSLIQSINAADYWRTADICDVIARLLAWHSASHVPWPFTNFSTDTLWIYLTPIKEFCADKLGYPPPLSVKDWREWQHSNEFVRWHGHIRNFPLHQSGPIDAFIDRSFQEDSIVVVGDIRRSQDLMTYGTDPASFTDNIEKFINATRDLVFKHRGVFDKFTGDGFVAYFNPGVAGKSQAECTDDFLRFLAEEHSFCSQLFEEWTQQLRKLPAEGIGLAIGADIGKVAMKHSGGHLIAVGDSIVWANRMAVTAKVGETVVNNALYHKLKDRDGLLFEERKEQTKTGEDFLARVIKLSPTIPISPG